MLENLKWKISGEKHFSTLLKMILSMNACAFLKPLAHEIF